jgi:hypothetical protein
MYGSSGVSSSFGKGSLGGNLATLPIGNGATTSTTAAGGITLKGLPSLPSGFGAQARPTASGVPAFKLSTSQSKSSKQAGNSVLPIDRSTQLSSSPLLGKNSFDDFTLPSSDSSTPIYAVLGLSNSSSPASSSIDANSDLTKTSTGELTFSLSGSLSATPTYSFSGVTVSGSTGGDTVIPASVPEPGSGLLSLTGLVGLAFGRRRRS